MSRCCRLVLYDALSRVSGVLIVVLTWQRAVKRRHGLYICNHRALQSRPWPRFARVGCVKEVLVWRANADPRPREGDNATTMMTGRGAASGGPHDAPEPLARSEQTR